MAADFDPIGLTPIDHITAKVYLPYMLYFSSNDSSTSIQTVRSGINKLIKNLPWLAGDVVIHHEPETRAFIHPPATPPHQVPVLTVRHFDSDEDFRTHPTAEYLPVPLFVPASEQRPVLRFQLNIFPTKVALVMSFMHMAFDGSGAGTVLQALSECCRAAAAENQGESVSTPIIDNLCQTATALRNKVSAWPSKCETRLDHSLELGPPAFDSNFSIEQWGAVESALSSMSSSHRLTFSAEKVAELKETCAELLPHLELPADTDSVAFSSNDIITAALGITLDRVVHADRDKQSNPTHMFMVADMRRRISPPLPETYLGNMIYPLWSPIHCAPGPAQESNDSDTKTIDPDLQALTHLATHLRSKVTNDVNSTLAHSCSAAVSSSGNWFQTEGKPADVVMTSWRHLKVFSLDFGPGLGVIEDFESGFVMMPGACIVMPARTRGGDLSKGKGVEWEVSVTVRPGNYEALVGDALLRRILA
ncbi:uncharacterized protein BDV14DRAFT_194457 [Aspergillus stella-maris]|uniref:uncharacterized protein n=1 Tax=Aspergillus stella-maris TaxID=1810926 RepID=UPI003CCCFD78